MKKLAFNILSALALIVCSVAPSLADPPVVPSGVLWERGNAAYVAGNYDEAHRLYDSIELSGVVSPKLYYNKAGALFKLGRVGESILYYSKAERLAPADRDVAYNLAIASSYTRNRIEPLPEFFLTRWRSSLGMLLGGDAWAWLSLVMLACSLAGALLYMLPVGRALRKRGFYGGLAAAVLLVVSVSFASADWRETASPTGGIVTGTSAAVKSSPDATGTDLFLLYEGDRVRLLDEMNGWSEIAVANGSRGWMRTDAISKID
jgi:tetratricopeptide (TPR) repeat protein